jgi:hypothetical protein
LTKQLDRNRRFARCGPPGEPHDEGSRMRRVRLHSSG